MNRNNNNIHDYICGWVYNKSLKGFGWNNVGPASQTVAQHYFTIGLYIRVVAFVTKGDQIVTPIAIATK